VDLDPLSERPFSLGSMPFSFVVFLGAARFLGMALFMGAVLAASVYASARCFHNLSLCLPWFPCGE